MSSARYAQHVVYAHEGVGHHNGFHGAPKGLRHGARVLLLAGVGQQFVGNPYQSHATHQHQTWNFEQPDHAQGHNRAHGNGANGAPHDGALLQVRGKLACG